MPPSLPSELWLEIITLLPRADLPNLARVSKTLYDLTVEPLYQNVDLTNQWNSHKATESFFWTAIKRPGLLRLVKQVTFQILTDPWLDNGATLIYHPDALKEYRWIQDLMITFTSSPSQAKEWCSALFEDENYLPVFDFLVCMMSWSLESLTVYDYGRISKYKDHYLPGALLRTTQQPQSDMDHPYPFSRLQEVKLYRETFKSTFQSIDSIIPFLELKSLKRFVGQKFIFNDSSPLNNELTTFYVESLELWDCKLPKVPFLQSFKALKTFKYTSQFEWMPCFADIMRVDLRIRESLQEIVFDDRIEECIEGHQCPLDLTSFKVLTSLELSSYSSVGSPRWRLFEYDADSSPIFTSQQIQGFITRLPRSLQYLKITDCIYEIIP